MVVDAIRLLSSKTGFTSSLAKDVFCGHTLSLPKKGTKVNASPHQTTTSKHTTVSLLVYIVHSTKYVKKKNMDKPRPDHTRHGKNN